MMYLVMLLVTAGVYQSKNIMDLHQYVGFKPIHIKYILIAVFLAILIWVLDYLSQTSLFKIDIKLEANNWYSKQNNILAAFVSTALIAPIIEEMLFRGIFLQTLNRYLNKFWSAITLSILFTLIHFSFIQAPSLFFASMVYVWLTYKSKSIIPAIFAHLINNCGTFIYYFSISH